ncbi:MAG: pantetheine-phosphate adenylyltransferase [Pseudomonadota bacterium]|jgi:pantetheine-phosphate adenylyltransferase
MVVAVYPGTFDPLTRGHEDLVRRASRLFDRVIVGVAASVGKSPLFTPEERLRIASEALAPLGNVEAVSFSGLLVNFLRKHDAFVVIRGIRAVSDFDYEFQLAGMNRNLMPEIETVFMTPGDQYQFISATLVREIAIMGGDVSRFVPPLVEERLREKVAQRARGA